MASVIADARKDLPRAFERAGYATKRQEALRKLDTERGAIISEVDASAGVHHHQLEAGCNCGSPDGLRLPAVPFVPHWSLSGRSYYPFTGPAEAAAVRYLGKTAQAFSVGFYRETP